MMDSKTQTDLSATALGRDIRALRKTRGLKQGELAEEIGRSLGFVSQIERGISTPSIHDLRALSKCLNVPISWFFDAGVQDNKHIVRKAQRRKLGTRQTGLTEELLSPDLGGSFEILRTIIEPNSESGAPIKRKTEEAGYVVSGQLDLWLNSQWHTLKSGDSFRFKNRAYRWRNSGGERVEIIWVISPPVY